MWDGKNKALQKREGEKYEANKIFKGFTGLGYKAQKTIERKYIKGPEK